MQPPPLNPYEAPQQMAVPPAMFGQDAVIIQGSCLLVPRQYEFPPICIKTGVTENLSKPITRKFAWYHPAWAFLFLLGFLIFIIVVLCIQKTGKVTFYISEEVRQKRRTRLLINWMIFLSIIPLFYISAVNEDYAVYAIIAAVSAIVTSLVLAMSWCRLILPRRIDEKYIYFDYKDPDVMQRVYAACMSRRNY